jgi:two-component system, chemotaxis family, response regulator Rcp1
MRTPRPPDPVNVLLVEDNPSDVRLVEDAFERVSDEIRIQAVTDGAEAMSLLEDRRTDEVESFPDLLLLDLNVPYVHGFEILEQLREDSALSALPVIVLTRSDDETDIAESYGLSANAYLTKPDDHDEFVSLARAVEEFWVKTAQLPSVPAM